MTYAQNETFAILDKFLLMQAKTGGGGGKSQEEVCGNCFGDKSFGCFRNRSLTLTE